MRTHLQNKDLSNHAIQLMEFESRRYSYRRLFSTVSGSVLSFLLIAATLSAQQSGADSSVDLDWKTMVGLYGGLSRNGLSGNLSSNELPGAIPGSGECGSFEQGNGLGMLLGLLFEYRFSSIFSGGLRIEYGDRSGAMSYRCIDPADTRLPDGSLVVAQTDHVADISLSGLTLQGVVGIRPFSFPLVLSAGLSASLGMGGDYQLTEKIVTPQTAEFVSGGQVREYGDGNLKGNGSSFGFGLLGAVGYELTAGEKWRLRPEASLILPLANDLEIGGIRSTGIRLTLGITRLFFPEPDKVLPQEPPLLAIEEPTPPAVPQPSTSERRPLEVILEANNGSGWQAETPMVIRRFTPVHTTLVPLLPYLFFDNRQGELTGRYIRLDQNSRGAFSERRLASHSNLDVYSHVLNIVGERLNRYPDAKLTITGTAPDVAEGTPSTTLATVRGESIRTYLHDVWNISNDRMMIVPRHDPEVATNPETSEGRVENRRVELSSDRVEILSPLSFADTLTPVENGQVRLTFRNFGALKDDILSWSITTQNRSGESTRQRGDGTLPQHLSLTVPPFSTFDDSDMLTTTLHVVRRDSTTDDFPLSLPVRRDETYNTLIAGGEYSLILFDAANADLRDEHRRIIDTIAALLPENAVISVFGYTDYLGDSVANRALSERRAQQVANRFTSGVDTVQGKGEDVTTFNVLGLPEERMYARRVVIEVRLKEMKKE